MLKNSGWPNSSEIPVRSLKNLYFNSIKPPISNSTAPPPANINPPPNKLGGGLLAEDDKICGHGEVVGGLAALIILKENNPTKKLLIYPNGEITLE